MARMLALFSALFISSSFVLTPAFAEPVETSADGFHLHLSRTSELSVPEMLSKLGDLPAWWSSVHTYSADAGNLNLSTLDPGGICRETSETLIVEHGRVIANIERGSDKVIRFDAAFGPLQEIAARGILTVTISPETDDTHSGRSSVRFDYYVTGASFQKLDQWALPVDGVLSEQIDRLAQN